MPPEASSAEAPAWSIAIMCYNEAARLEETVRRTRAMLRQYGETFEILVVDDGSQDGSGPLADRLAAEAPEVRVLHHPVNQGIGPVLLDGYYRTRGKIVCILPADLQFAPEDLPEAMRLMAGADVVNISRRARHDPPVRTLISFVDRTLVWLLFGLRAGDLHWVKLYRREVLEKVTLTSRTPLVDTELLIRAKRLKARIVQVSLPHHPRTAGTSKGGNWRLLARTFAELVKLRWRI